MLFTSSSSCLTTLLFAVLSWLSWLMWLWPLELHTSCMMWCIPLYECSVVWFHWFFFFFVFFFFCGCWCCILLCSSPFVFDVSSGRQPFWMTFHSFWTTFSHPSSEQLSRWFEQRHTLTRRVFVLLRLCKPKLLRTFRFSFEFENTTRLDGLMINSFLRCFLVMSLSVLAMPSVCCPLCGWPEKMICQKRSWWCRLIGSWQTQFFACGSFNSWRTFELKLSWHALFIAPLQTHGNAPLQTGKATLHSDTHSKHSIANEAVYVTRSILTYDVISFPALVFHLMSPCRAYKLDGRWAEQISEKGLCVGKGEGWQSC